MDLGDLFRLIFLGFILFSLFGGLFGRGGKKEEERPSPRPTDVFESGGQDRPRPTQPQRQQPQRPPQERQMPTTASEWWEELTGQRARSQPQPQPERRQGPVPAAHEERWETQTFDRPERHREEVRERYGTSDTRTHDDAIESDRAAGLEARSEAARRRYGTEDGQGEILERDISDMPAPMDVFPGRRGREIGATNRRRRRRTGGDVLRRSLKDPATLERSFILKEVLDDPLALRRKN